MQVEGTSVHRGSAPVVAHPGWCDPRRCVESDGDVQHCSELVLLRTLDAQLRLAWVQTDEFDAEQPGVTELRVDISYAAPGVRAQLFLTPREVRQLGSEQCRRFGDRRAAVGPTC
jgi:hypothetical protein